MKRLLCLTLFCVAPAAFAGGEIVALSPQAASALSGKVVTVTRHVRPQLRAAPPAKRKSGLQGSSDWTSDDALLDGGWKIVSENQVPDPADIVERELVPVLAEQYGFTVKQAPVWFNQNENGKDIVKPRIKLEGDYLLDIESKSWNLAQDRGDRHKYWTAYSVKVELVDRVTGKRISTARCDANNAGHPAAPTRDALLEDGASLFRAAMASHAWACVQLLAKDQFALPENRVAATPRELYDPLTAYALSRRVPTAVGTPAN